jgi:precorrin-3B synthase
MATGDGFLLRIRPRIGRLSAEEARAVAAVARGSGNGLIDLTSRGNLQLRGLQPDTLEEAQALLAAAGLLDGTPEAEATRNVLVSPLTGLDPTAICDASGPARALEAVLANLPTPSSEGAGLPLPAGGERSAAERAGEGHYSLAVLPPPFTLTLSPLSGDDGIVATSPGTGDGFALPDKFLWLVDDVGAVALDDIAADVRFRAVSDGAGHRWAIGLDTGNGPAWVGSCNADALPATAERLARAFIAVAGTARRMRELDEQERARLVACAGLDGSGRSAAAAERASRSGECPPLPGGERAGVRGDDPSCMSLSPPHPADARPTSPRRGEMNARPSIDAEREVSRHGVPVVGLWPLGERCILTVTAPFGRLTADGLDQLAGPAEDFGIGELRFGPWRQIHVPGAPGMDLAPALEQAAAAGFITDSGDARLAIAACPGKPACASGETAAQTDAALIAAAAPSLGEAGLSLHISGCVKGCARPASAALTLVGDQGRYALVRGASTRATPLVHVDTAGAAAGLAHLVAAGGEPALARLTDKELCSMFEAADG